MAAAIGLVYLAWGPYGTEPLERFLLAHERNPPGVEHDLIVLFNGIAAAGDAHPAPPLAPRAPFERVLEQLAHRRLELHPPVLDLSAYQRAARMLENPVLCFLNMRSEPLVEGWLELLAALLRRSGVGMVGATGSWASQSSHVRYLLGLGGPYARAFDDRDEVMRVFAASPSHNAAPQPRRRPTLADRARGARLLARQLGGFPPFPAPHLRSNAFLLERELFLRVCGAPAADKTDAYLLESGRRSFTRRVRKIGMEVLVAGRDGTGYAPERWPESRTFWQGRQENLLVADNQTRAYERGNPQVRRTLSVHAWGSASDQRAAPADAPARGLARYEPSQRD